MTVFTSIRLDKEDDVSLVGIQTGIISGTVTKNGSGVSRRIHVYHTAKGLVAEAYSDKDDGTYSLSVVVGTNDFFTVVFFGESGENDIVYGHIVPVLV